MLKGIDVDIYPGQLVVVFGPSGSGKSTMLHIMLGLENPSEGTVEFLGNRMDQATEDQAAEIRKNNVGIIYQQPNWIKSMSVISNTAFPLLLRGENRQTALVKARKILEMVGMDQWAGYYPMELSSGQQQKVALARSLITDPPIIFADEPTGNLDFQSSTDLMNLFDKLSQEGKTIVMISHNLDNLEAADRVIQFFDGMIIRDIDCTKHTFEEVKQIVTEKIELTPEQQKLEAEAKSTEPVINLHFKQNKKRISLTLGGELRTLGSQIFRLLNSIVLLVLYLGYRALYAVLLNKYMPGFTRTLTPKITSWYLRFIMLLEKQRPNSIRYIELIDISLKNLFAKKTRAAVTIGGVAVGIGFIIFLVSLGFGLEQLVISRVAGLNQLRQLDATPAVSANLVITDETLAKFATIKNLEKTLPIISIAGKVNYQNSVFDVVIEGVQADYLKESDLVPTSGKVFESNELAIDMSDVPDGQVAGLSEDELLITPVEPEVTKIDLPTEKVSKQAVVNESLLELINVLPADAVGRSFKLTLIATQDVTGTEKFESYPEEYQIVGVVREGATPFLYVPITDVRLLGAVRYTQVKVVATDRAALADVRRNIELQGFRTTSTVDTVEEIERLFVTIRQLLGLVGGIALVVAALGMFNTLTVSLLERTREVGLMKTLGMHTEEIKELFMVESMTMGFLGGILGVLMGIGAGKFLSLVLSLVAMSRGSAPFDISYVPTWFMVIVVGAAVIVAVATGIYPAIRAMRISALNALRYE